MSCINTGWSPLSGLHRVDSTLVRRTTVDSTVVRTTVVR